MILQTYQCAARGTTEPLNPSYGIVVGDPLFNAVKAMVPDVSGYSVNVRLSITHDMNVL
jgi:hypothetical protein